MSKFIKSTLALVTLALVAMVALTTVKADATDETREAYGTVIGIGKSTTSIHSHILVYTIQYLLYQASVPGIRITIHGKIEGSYR